MVNAVSFDKTVGRIAGAIYSDLAHLFSHPPLMLVPPLTFKVRKVLERVTDVSRLSGGQKGELANEIRVAVVPVLFSYDLEPDMIERMAPIIEAAAYKALTREASI